MYILYIYFILLLYLVATKVVSSYNISTEFYLSNLGTLKFKGYNFTVGFRIKNSKKNVLWVNFMAENICDIFIF